MNIITAYTPKKVNLIDYYFDLSKRGRNRLYMDDDKLWLLYSDSTYIQISHYRKMDNELDEDEKAEIKSLLNQDYVGTIIVWTNTNKLYELLKSTLVEKMVLDNDYGSILKIEDVKNMNFIKLKSWLNVQ
ncbi:MAG: hypothetical protein KA291_01395 [Psychrobacter sp.]|nr:hypothetical protein [Psychrobacter sp.]